MNKVEAWKSEKHGFDVWSDIESYAKAKTAMAGIAEADLERMKWFGIFYRKRVEDGRYMIRVRIPGCELTSPQARTLAGLARQGYSIIDVTTRGNIQIQGFAIEDLPGVVEALDAVGLTGKQTGHDNVRNVMTHPWAGLDPEELIDVRPLCVALTEVFLDSRELSDLPRKFNVAVEGRSVPALHCWTQDTSFVAGTRPDGSTAFHWLLAGTQGQNPKLAWKLPVWVTEAQAPEVLLQSLHVFKAEGAREKRDKARLRYLVEKVGDIGFLERVEARLGYTLERNEKALPPVDENEDFIGWFPQKQEGRWALGVSVPLGRLTHEQFAGLANLAETLGDGTLRTAYDQGVVIPNILYRHKVAAVRALNRLGLEHEADSVTRNVVACTGRQFCNIAVSETKGHAFGLMERLRNSGIGLHGIKINMSGCPSSCAQTYTGDIGLKGVRVRRKGGTRDGFDVFLGGGAHGPVELGLPYCKGVDVDQLPELIGSLVRTYDLEHEGETTFSQFWRARIAAGHVVAAVSEAAHRPDVWVCESCDHRHLGEDPPVFCPKCASLRKRFARLDDQDQAEAPLPAETKSAARTDGYIDVASFAQLQRDGRLAARAGDADLALFLIDGAVQCTDGLCPHEGGPMAQGDVADGVVTCPWHGWAFQTKDGQGIGDHGCSLRSYPTKVEGDRILVAFSPAPAQQTASPSPASAALPELTLRVIDVIEETHDTKTIRLDNADRRLPSHSAGQHVKLGVLTSAGHSWRSFTLSSPPTRPDVLDVTIKRNPDGIVSTAAHQMKPGDFLLIKGPQGQFIFDPDRHTEPLVLAVAGSGVTPAMSILRTINDRQLDLPVTLFYGCRDERDVIFARELDQLRLRLANFRMILTLSQPHPTWTGSTGRVTPALVARHTPDLASARYFVCGPGAMRDSLVNWLQSQGASKDRIHTEMFGKSTTSPKPTRHLAASELSLV